MPKGKYFFIKSKSNGMVLDIESGNGDPGTRVCLWSKKDEDDADNQLFYVDLPNRAIRSKMNNMVLDIDEDENSLIINYFDEGKDNQNWRIDDDRIMNGADRDQVLDVAGDEDSKGARVCKWEWHDADNQRWKFVHVKPRYFFIKSEMNGKVIDIPGADDSADVKVIMYDQGDGDKNQLWYEDEFGNIRSKLNEYCLDASRGKTIRMQPADPENYNQRWSICGEKIINNGDRDQVLDIKRASDENGARLCRYEDHGSDNQRWSLEYCD